jgi:lysophospholipase L1-like esterase
MVKNLALILAAVIGFCLVAEVALRCYDLVRGIEISYRVPLRPYLIFGPDFYARDGDSIAIRSSHGRRFPLEKERGTVRIVTFGGSTTADDAVYSEHGVDYPSVLETLLKARFPNRRIEVINVAYAAYSSAHSLVILALDVLSWDADIVILSHNVNDLTAAYVPGFTPDYGNKYKQDPYMPGFEEFVLRQSRLYRFVVARLTALGAFQYPPTFGSYDDAPPRRAQAVFERNLRSFVTSAQSHGLQVVLGSQARNSDIAAFRENLKYKDSNAFMIEPDFEIFFKHHDFFNGLIRRVAHDTGVVFVDNQTELGGKPEYFADGVHYTLAGVERVAEDYMEAIVAAGLIAPGSLAEQAPAHGSVPRGLAGTRSFQGEGPEGAARRNPGLR